jgi:hypothetical protein
MSVYFSRFGPFRRFWKRCETPADWCARQRPCSADWWISRVRGVGPSRRAFHCSIVVDGVRRESKVFGPAVQGASRVDCPQGLQPQLAGRDIGGRSERLRFRHRRQRLSGETLPNEP